VYGHWQQGAVYAFGDMPKKLLAQPNPEPEPVAWLLSSKTSIYTEFRKTEPEGTDMYLYTVTPLYTAPPQPEPLTDEDICEVLIKKDWKGLFELARNIEKAHGIGGEE
jgi:hypothetical protein